jgi:YVTN family beta-propeller protein
VYVTNQQDNTLSVIDGRTYKVVATVPAGVAPEGVAVTKDGRHVYIANSGSARVSVLDTGNNKIVTTVPVGKSPTSASARTAGPSMSPTAVPTPSR